MSILSKVRINWRSLANDSLAKRVPKTILRSIGIDLVKFPKIGDGETNSVGDFSPTEQALIMTVQPFTMTGIHRVAALLNAVNYIMAMKIPGDIVECGVWRGGSMMAVASALLAHGDTSRSLFLYDTFEGMSAPTDKDKLTDGTLAAQLLERDARGTGVWCEAGIDDVRQNIFATGYPKDKIHFIKGKVEDTIPKTLPGHLALLRLDTDWYESTKHELIHLFPLLDARGVLILDDYGSWQGARTAVDEYFRENKRNDFLHRIDATGRIMIRNGT